MNLWEAVDYLWGQLNRDQYERIRDEVPELAALCHAAHEKVWHHGVKSIRWEEHEAARLAGKLTDPCGPSCPQPPVPKRRVVKIRSAELDVTQHSKNFAPQVHLEEGDKVLTAGTERIGNMWYLRVFVEREVP